MKITKHASIFVLATGIAAFVHSTWSLATFFGGEQPETGIQLVGWLVPALLISFALDVGQIQTSAEIRKEGLSWTRGITFGVFALATYYLQWLYMAHHMPELSMAGSVRDEWLYFSTLLRDASIWIIPALLPLSTLLYTFSGGQVREAAIEQSVKQPAKKPQKPIVVKPIPFDTVRPQKAESRPFGAIPTIPDELESTAAMLSDNEPIASANGKNVTKKDS